MYIYIYKYVYIYIYLYICIYVNKDVTEEKNCLHTLQKAIQHYDIGISQS
jgi:hypothetical protein